MKPWLLEVNQSPSFSTDSPLDYKVKKQVLFDTFNLMNVSYEKRVAFQQQKKAEAEKRIYTGKVTKIAQDDREKLRKDLLNERQEFEKTRQGGYELIYPSRNEQRNQDYQQFIDRANYLWDEFTTGNKNKKLKE